MNLNEFLNRVKSALDSAGVPYMVTGSVAAAAHGAVRSTQDVDVVIAPDEAQFTKLLAQFPEEDFYISRDAANEAFKSSAQFNVIDHDSGWKIDFIICKPRNFSRAEFDRRRPADVFGINMNVASPEDVIIAKLEWARTGESARQMEDAARLLRASAALLDRGYIERWIRELNLQREWSEAQRLSER